MRDLLSAAHPKWGFLSELKRGDRSNQKAPSTWKGASAAIENEERIAFLSRIDASRVGTRPATLTMLGCLGVGIAAALSGPTRSAAPQADAAGAGLLYGNQAVVTEGQTGNNYLYAPQPGPLTIQSSGGGIGADIAVTGSQTGAPTVALVTNGLTVIQSGPGIGMRAVVNGGNGPTIGVLSTVGR